MNPKVEFVQTSRRWRGALSARTLAKSAIAAAVAECGLKLKRGAEVCVHLVGDEDIRALNAQWRGKHAPTNVLSFPAVEAARVAESPLLGDIFVAFETVKREAGDEEKPLGDHFRHLVIHGFLHLIGFDHIEPSDAEAMEAMEVRALARLGVEDPYARRELADAT